MHVGALSCVYIYFIIVSLLILKSSLIYNAIYLHLCTHTHCNNSRLIAFILISQGSFVCC